MGLHMHQSFRLSLLVLGIFLLAFWLRGFFTIPADCALEVRQTDIEVDGAVAGHPSSVLFDLHNRAGRPVRVLGWSQC